jgi:hypothetical protein
LAVELISADVHFVQGPEFSCYTLAHQGRVVVHSDTAAELSNLNYKYEAVPEILTWVCQFVNRSSVSGQVGLSSVGVWSSSIMWWSVRMIVQDVIHAHMESSCVHSICRGSSIERCWLWRDVGRKE